MMSAWKRVLCLLGTLGAMHWAHADPVVQDPLQVCRDWILSEPFAERHPSRTQVISAQAACMDGAITEASLQPLQAWIDAVPAQLQPLLVVRSGGGDAKHAIMLAEKLQARKARVHVLDVCASSCANYFFPGVSDRHADDGTLMLFHGGYNQSGLEEVREHFDAFLATPEGGVVTDPTAAWRGLEEDFRQMWARQDALYQRVGVNALIVHGLDAMEAGLDAQACGGRDPDDVEYFYFGAALAQRLGMAPVSGQLADVPAHVQARVQALGRATVVCKVPDAALDGRLEAGQMGPTVAS